MHISSFLPPHEISLFAGSSGAGKSTLLMQYIQAQTQGKAELFGMPIPNQAKFGFVKADRLIKDISDVADRIGFDMGLLPTVSVTEDLHIDPSKLHHNAPGLLWDILTQLKTEGVTHVIVDPFSVFVGEDLNRYHKVAPILIIMNRWAKQNEITIVGTHHTTKPRSDFHFLRPQDRISGSAALGGYTSTQFMLSGANELQTGKSDRPADDCARLDICSHTAAPEVVWLRRDTNGIFEYVSELVAGPTSIGPVATTLLESIPPEFPVESSTLYPHVMTLTGKSLPTLYREMDKLISMGLVERLEKGSYQRLPIP